MRTITTHIVEGDDPSRQLQIYVMDDPGQGGANHKYWITAEATNIRPHLPATIRFQNGTVEEAGVNGVTPEALLAILVDWLEVNKDGEFHRSMALAHCVNALAELKILAQEKIQRGVEGINQQ